MTPSTTRQQAPRRPVPPMGLAGVLLLAAAVSAACALVQRADAAPLEQGRVGMADLLDLVLPPTGEETGALAVSDATGLAGPRVFKAPLQGSPPLLLPVQASAPFAGPFDTVTFGAQEIPAAEAAEPYTWEGGVTSEPAAGRLEAVLNLRPLTQGMPPFARRAVSLSAMLNARLLETGALAYESINEPGAAPQVSLMVLDESADADRNALPDTFGELAPGVIWAARDVGAPVDNASLAPRLAVAANLLGDAGEPGGSVVLMPTRGVQVEIPNTQSLLEAGAIPAAAAPQAEAYAVLVMARGPEGLLDAGRTSYHAAHWVRTAALSAAAVLTPMADGQPVYLAVLLAYSTDGGQTVVPIQSIGSQRIVLTLRGFDPELLPAAMFRLDGLALATQPTPMLAATSPQGNWIWSSRAEHIGGGSVRVALPGPGLFAPYRPTAVPGGAAAKNQPTEPSPQETAGSDGSGLGIESVFPDSAWIFGGRAVEVTGWGFTGDTQFQIGGAPARAVVTGPTRAVVLAPAHAGPLAKSTPVAISAAEGGMTAQRDEAFQYRRVQDGDPLVTAFTLAQARQGGERIALPYESEHGAAFLEAPPLRLEESSRNSAVGLAMVHPSGPMLGGFPGAPVPGAPALTVQFYESTQPTDEELGAMEPGQYALAPIPFRRMLQPTGQLVPGRAMRLGLPLAEDGPSYADVAAGRVSLWAASAQASPATLALQPGFPGAAQYQSALLAAEVNPDFEALAARKGGLDGAVLAAERPRQVYAGRVYEGAHFALRLDAPLPPRVTSQFHLAGGREEGPLTGGNTVIINAPQGGLGWVERIELVHAKTGASLMAEALLPGPGVNEFDLAFDTPAAPRAGAYDVVVHVGQGPAAEKVGLGQVYEYKQGETPAWVAPALVVAGLAAALVGIFAGGNSGGGGGGPCFVATAVMGTPLAFEVDALRLVRDDLLLSNPAGAALVDVYYRVGPGLADFIAAHPWAAALARVLLLPVFVLAKAYGVSPVLAAGMLLLALAFIWRWRRIRRARRTQNAA